MAADLHIHVMTPEMTEAHLADFFSNTMGSRWFAPKSVPRSEETWEIVSKSPNIHVGEVSWLKAALLGENDRYVPDPIQAVSDIITDDLPVIDDELIERVRAALSLENKTGYGVSPPDRVVAFLQEHKGKRAFTVSW